MQEESTSAGVSSPAAPHTIPEPSHAAASIRWRASTPAAYQVEPFAATQRCQVVKCISAIAWKFEPSARIRQAWSGLGWVLLPAIAGMEMV